jgi:MinD-like ATPase involved in chromosome partitioning or flagellar assembly
MALANTAVLLARWGYKVLAIDWDLEAPGLGNYFQDEKYADLQQVSDHRGIVDLLYSISDIQNKSKKPSWRDYVVSVKLQDTEQTIDLLPPGQINSEYFKKVRNFDVHEFYLNRGGGYFIEALRGEWKSVYDFVLIDSRTGITDDIGGICTIQLPDILVLFIPPNEQGISGSVRMAKQASVARQDLPFDRPKLLTVPIATRFDFDNGSQQSKYWLTQCLEKAAGFYTDWLPAAMNQMDLLEITKLPYKAHYSFGEKLAVMEESTLDPSSLGYAYVTLAALIANKLENVVELRESRDNYVRAAFKLDRKRHQLPLAFMSYVRLDDEYENGQLTEFRKRLSAEVHLQTGREFPIFQDRDDIQWGQKWQERIEKSLDEVTFLIPIITPTFFNSSNCRRELEYFIQREKKLRRNDLILPVYYVDYPLLNDEEKQGADILAQEIATRQLADWRRLRFEPYTSPQVRKTLADLAVQIRDALERVTQTK